MSSFLDMSSRLRCHRFVIFIDVISSQMTCRTICHLGWHGGWHVIWKCHPATFLDDTACHLGMTAFPTTFLTKLMTCRSILAKNDDILRQKKTISWCGLADFSHFWTTFLNVILSWPKCQKCHVISMLSMTCRRKCHVILMLLATCHRKCCLVLALLTTCCRGCCVVSMSSMTCCLTSNCQSRCRASLDGTSGRW